MKVFRFLWLPNCCVTIEEENNPLSFSLLHFDKSFRCNQLLLIISHALFLGIRRCDLRENGRLAWPQLDCDYLIWSESKKVVWAMNGRIFCKVYFEICCWHFQGQFRHLVCVMLCFPGFCYPDGYQVILVILKQNHKPEYLNWP